MKLDLHEFGFGVFVAFVVILFAGLFGGPVVMERACLVVAIVGGGIMVWSRLRP